MCDENFYSNIYIDKHIWKDIVTSYNLSLCHKNYGWQWKQNNMNYIITAFNPYNGKHYKNSSISPNQTGYIEIYGNYTFVEKIQHILENYEINN